VYPPRLADGRGTLFSRVLIKLIDEPPRASKNTVSGGKKYPSMYIVLSSTQDIRSGRQNKAAASDKTNLFKRIIISFVIYNNIDDKIRSAAA
jgi:hypothetical protein